MLVVQINSPAQITVVHIEGGGGDLADLVAKARKGGSGGSAGVSAGRAAARVERGCREGRSRAENGFWHTELGTMAEGDGSSHKTALARNGSLYIR